MKIELRDPQDLLLSPALKHFPEPDWEGEEARAVRAGMKQRIDLGIPPLLEPILLDSAERVATDHGRTLLHSAKKWQLKTVPVHHLELDAHTLILHELTGRRQFTKNARAFLAYPQLKPAFEIAQKRRLDCLRKGQKPQCFSVVECSTTEATSIEELAAILRIDRKTLFEAQKVHGYFEKYADRKFKFVQHGGDLDGALVQLGLREYYEPRILRPPIGGEHEQNRPMGLGAVIAAITFHLSDKNYTGGARPAQTYEQLHFCSNAAKRIVLSLQKYDSLPREVAAEADASLQAIVKAAPEHSLEKALRLRDGLDSWKDADGQ